MANESPLPLCYRCSPIIPCYSYSAWFCSLTLSTPIWEVFKFLSSVFCTHRVSQSASTGADREKVRQKKKRRDRDGLRWAATKLCSHQCSISRHDWPVGLARSCGIFTLHALSLALWPWTEVQRHTSLPFTSEHEDWAGTRCWPVKSHTPVPPGLWICIYNLIHHILLLLLLNST